MRFDKQVIWWPGEVPTLQTDISFKADENLDGLSIFAGFHITLRSIQNSDIEDIFREIQDPLVPRFTTVPEKYTLTDAKSFVQNKVPTGFANQTEILFVVTSISLYAASPNGIETSNTTNKLDLENSTLRQDFCGVISLHTIDFKNHHAEIGYWFAKDARGKGIAVAAIELITEYGLMTMGFRRVEALVDIDNIASRKSLVKAGYEFEGILKQRVTRSDGRQIDMAIFGATRI